MDINKGKLVYIKNKSSYNNNVFLDTLVIFVEDTKEIITHGISFAGIPSSYNMYVGAKNKKANASTTNGNTYIKLYKDSTLSNQFNIKGTGATTVVSDASGNITINSTDNNTWRALQVKGTQIAGTRTNTYPINFVEGTDITLTGTAGTSTTKLNSITINHASISTTVTKAKDTATLLAYSGEITVPTAITTNNGHITAYTWTKYKLPAASHYTTHIYAGASGATANSTSDVSNPYLTVVDDTTYRNQVQFKGRGKTTVKANGGIITISSTDTWNAFIGATSSKAGTAGYVPAPSSGQTGLYFRSDGTWATPPGTYSLPTASNNTLGGVKTGSAITDTSGYTAVHIKDGVIYYKNTTYSTKALKINGNTYNVYTSNASLPTIYAPTAVGTAGQVLATNSNADGLEWKSVATTTKSMKVNGNNYSIYTTGTSLPTIYAPTSLGTSGQVLKMNSDGTGLVWATDATIANTWRPVKALKSDGTTLGTLNNNSTTLSLKAGSNITLAYSSGTITITGVGNTWTALKGATASANGTAGYAPKPTKGQQGYYLKGNATWVKPSLSEFTDDVVSGKYLPLSGGTLTGNILLGGTTTNKIGTNIVDTTSWQEFTHQNSHGYIAIGPFNDSVAHIYTDRPSFYFNKELYVNSAKVWNAGNDGSGSTLDADLLDGKHLSDILASNVASATKLQTTRTIWGQSFDGTGNVSGNLNADGSHISASFFDITRYGKDTLTMASIFSGNNDGTNYGLILEAAQSTTGALMPIFIGWRGGKRIMNIQNDTGVYVHHRMGIGQNTNGTAMIDAYDGIARFGCDDYGAGRDDSVGDKKAFISIKGVTGNVGIGTLNASSKLQVAGTITCTAIQGDSSSNNLTFRHIDGLNCNGDYNLYLQYHNPSYKTYFNGITYYIDGANYNGTAAKANKLSTARTISLTGSVTGSGSFDGSGNLSIATSTNHTHSYLPLSGGTMTGNISWNTDSHGIYLFNGCGIEKWSGYGPSLVAETGTDFHISKAGDRSTRYLILHTGNWKNHINVSTSSTNNARFYNITTLGSGTYNIGQIFNGNNGETTYGFAVEAALASDSDSAAKLPMFFGWRGGKIGAKLSEGNFDIYYSSTDFSGLNFWRSNNTCFHLSNRSTQNKFSIFYYDGSNWNEHGWVTTGGLFNFKSIAINGQTLTFVT